MFGRKEEQIQSFVARRVPRILLDFSPHLGDMDLEGLSSSSLLEFNNKSVEETIIEVSRWALLAIRIPGYLPLTTIRSNFGLQLELVHCSASTFYTIFISLFTILGNCFFAHTFFDKFFLTEKTDSSDGRYGNTEAFVWISLLCLVCYTTYLRLTRIFYCRSSLKYWKGTIGLIESFVALDYHLNSAKLRSIYSSSRNWTIFYILVGFGRMGYGVYNLYGQISTSFDTLTASEIKALCLDLFLALTLCYHVGYSIWLTFLVKLLTFCFQTMHDDLKLHRQRVYDQKTGRRSSFLFHTDNNEGKSADGLLEMETRIRKTVQAYEAIEDQMHKFNKLFGTSIVLETMFAFILLIVNVYASESSWEPSHEIVLYVFFTMGVPIVIYATSLFHFATECSILSGKATTTLKNLEQFFVPNDRAELQLLQLKLVGFIARVADNPPSISASHFFAVNRRLLTSILGAVTTYLVVLLQFRESGSSQGSTALNQTIAAGIYCENASWTCRCEE